jgi:DNA polymerase III subunit delta
MPSGTFSSVQADIKAGKPAPVYLIVGDDERGKDEVVHLFDALVPEDIRPFNLERLSAPESDPAAVVAISRTYPLLGDRRVVVVTRAEKWLTSRRKGSGDDDGGGAGDDDGGVDDGGRGNDVLAEYVESPETGTCLVLVAADINRTTKLSKTLVKHAMLVECWGLKGEKELRGFGINEALERAQKFIIAAAKKAGMTIDRNAMEPLMEHAGTDIATLRGDVERVILYCHGRTNITLEDVRTIVSGATLINAWAVTNAIEKSDAGEAMRQLRLSLESGAAPFMVLGQLAWYVRNKMPTVAPGRVRPAVEAVFRTDLAMKSSGGEPKVLLERLVVELCGVPASRGGRPASFRR